MYIPALILLETIHIPALVSFEYFFQEITSGLVLYYFLSLRMKFLLKTTTL